MGNNNNSRILYDMPEVRPLPIEQKEEKEEKFHGVKAIDCVNTIDPTELKYCERGCQGTDPITLQEFENMNMAEMSEIVVVRRMDAVQCYNVRGLYLHLLTHNFEPVSRIPFDQTSLDVITGIYREVMGNPAARGLVGGVEPPAPPAAAMGPPQDPFDPVAPAIGQEPFRFADAQVIPVIPPAAAAPPPVAQTPQYVRLGRRARRAMQTVGERLGEAAASWSVDRFMPLAVEDAMLEGRHAAQTPRRERRRRLLDLPQLRERNHEDIRHLQARLRELEQQEEHLRQEEAELTERHSLREMHRRMN